MKEYEYEAFHERILAEDYPSLLDKKMNSIAEGGWNIFQVSPGEQPRRNRYIPVTFYCKREL